MTHTHPRSRSQVDEQGPNMAVPIDFRSGSTSLRPQTQRRDRGSIIQPHVIFMCTSTGVLPPASYPPPAQRRAAPAGRGEGWDAGMWLEST